MGGQNAEKVMNFAQQGENLEGDIQARKAMFEQMGKNWSGSSNCSFLCSELNGSSTKRTTKYDGTRI